MNIEYIKAMLVQIEKSKGDYEVAHGLEDSLMIDFIELVSTIDLENHIIDIEEMADEILKVKNIDFPRYCA